MSDFVILHRNCCTCVASPWRDADIASMPCEECGDSFGFGVPIVTNDGAFLSHMSCVMSKPHGSSIVIALQQFRQPLIVPTRSARSANDIALSIATTPPFARIVSIIGADGEYRHIDAAWPSQEALAARAGISLKRIKPRAT